MIGNSKDWLEAQVAVLGSVMLDDRWAGEVVLKTGPEDYSGAYRTIYKAIRELFQAGQPIDPAIVRGKLGPEYATILQSMMEITVTAANCGEYIKLAKEQARLIQLQELSEKVKTAPTLEAARELVAQCNALVTERSNVRMLSLAGSVPAFLERHRNEKKYLTWGFDDLDESLYCERGDFVVLGGYPSAGKTALALQFGWHQSATKRIGFFSLETTEHKLHDRAMTMITRVAFDRIKRNQLTEADVGAIGYKARQIEQHQMDFIQAANWTVLDIQAFSLAQKYEIIYIDYLQLIRPSDPRRSRVEQVSQISMDLHQMAQATGITVVALSQLSRPESKGENVKAPGMSALRESGQLEQDADVVMLLYKEEPKHPKSRRACRVAKNKEGETFGFVLDFDGNTQTFKKSLAGPLILKPQNKEPELDQVSFKELPAVGETPFDGSEA
jgi:replicative DNA helicase